MKFLKGTEFNDEIQFPVKEFKISLENYLDK